MSGGNVCFDLLNVVYDRISATIFVYKIMNTKTTTTTAIATATAIATEKNKKVTKRKKKENNYFFFLLQCLSTKECDFKCLETPCKCSIFL